MQAEEFPVVPPVLLHGRGEAGPAPRYSERALSSRLPHMETHQIQISRRQASPEFSLGFSCSVAVFVYNLVFSSFEQVETSSRDDHSCHGEREKCSGTY